MKKEEDVMTLDDRAAKLFNGYYTIQSAQTGEHRTFWVRTQPDDAEFAPGARVLGLLTGSENDNPDHYTNFAFVDDLGIHVWPSKKGPGKRWEEYADMLWTLALDGAFSPWAAKGFRVMEDSRCLICNRLLTTPESIRRGIGPICAERGV